MRPKIFGDTHTYASEPLLGTGTAEPIGMKRSAIARRRLSTERLAGVTAPTGAMIQVSWPRTSSSSARCSMWWFTPPGTVQEYGDTRPTRTRSLRSAFVPVEQEPVPEDLGRVRQRSAG